MIKKRERERDGKIFIYTKCINSSETSISKDEIEYAIDSYDLSCMKVENLLKFYFLLIATNCGGPCV